MDRECRDEREDSPDNRKGDRLILEHDLNVLKRPIIVFVEHGPLVARLDSERSAKHNHDQRHAIRYFDNRAPLHGPQLVNGVDGGG